ncbi:TlpA disulfide reductase family protein [uncultured Jannaschia sp.]|uniref:TlpA family protein disulfide reductase n=1 Tax=uncultured Jannaschia sp. TaxID=293347 RepID=UPI00260FE350|nr:TlpA disulfide reductase family protein [uncultured Jannaschia sp.]
MIRRTLCALTVMVGTGGPSMAEEAAFDFDMHETPIAVPDLQFADEAGSVRTLDDYRGKYVVVNVWATWCAPCREELPTLDALQRSIGGPAFEVIALSTETGRRPAVERLFTELSITDLEALIDISGSTMRDLGAYALPATVLIDRTGQEMGRKIGPADWDSPAAIEFFKALP